MDDFFLNTKWKMIVSENQKCSCDIFFIGAIDMLIHRAYISSSNNGETRYPLTS